MQFLSAAQTREQLPFGALIDALRTMFAEGCELPARQVHEIVGPEGDAVTSLVMPAWQRGGCYGVKVVNIAPGNSARGLPGLHSSYVLYDATTGVPLAWLDGNEITARRTAATSALAASWLAREDACRLAIVGAGRVASLLAEAHRVHRPIERVTVWARDSDRAHALAVSLASQGFDARVAASVEAAVADADIVSCATLASSPIVEGRWLSADSHLDLIGSFTPSMREADDACFAGAAVFVDSDDAATKSGDLIGPIARGVVAVGDIGTLSGLARGRRPRRDVPARRTVFKSVGSALEDLAAAMLVQRGAPAMH
ncbi:MAG TPA: ornithine cyclodeaminase family protein [Caldimonas sp.]|nr:ornithine cyclodeaminase family protein [Caldimonas sp.]HEX4235524.1 ornithine cyclodeaminase family protein [Caldimonas sp.]